jgi:hypothetical protein
VRVGAGFVGPVEGVFVQETVSVYGDAATAEAAFRANQQGLSCSQGEASGSPVVIAPAEDLVADVPADEATAGRSAATASTSSSSGPARANWS